MSEEAAYEISNVNCGDCVNTVKNELANYKSKITIVSAIVVPGTGKGYLEVIYRNRVEDETEVKNALSAIGHDIEDTLPRVDSRTLLYRGIIATVLGIVQLVLSMLQITFTGNTLYVALALNCLVMLYSGQKIYAGAYHNLKIPKFSMDLLFSVGATLALGMALLPVFVHTMPVDMMMCSAPLLMFGIRNLGKYIQEKISRYLADVNLLARLRTQKVTVIKKGKQTSEPEYDIYQLETGDVIELNSGEIIPTDGECVTETGVQINDSVISGQNNSRLFKKGEKLVAGMEARSKFQMKVAVPVKQCSVAVRQRRMIKAFSQKTPIEKTADTMLQYFVPAVFLTSLASGLSVWLVTHDPWLVAHMVVVIIAGSCPCVLGVIIPLIVAVTLDKARKYDLEIHSAAALEIAKRVSLASLDLTGTVTESKALVKNFKIYGQPHADVWKIVYALEHDVDHIFARAIKEYVETNHLDATSPVLEVNNKITHAGVRAQIDGTTYLLGNAKFLKESKENILVSPAMEKSDDLSRVVYLASANRVLLGFELTLPVRRETPTLVDRLKQMNIDVGLCTGSAADEANPYGVKLKILPGNIQAECQGDREKKFPKVNEIKQWKEKHVVMHVGDNVNDESGFVESNLGVLVQLDAKEKKASYGAEVQGSLITIKGPTLLRLLSIFELYQPMQQCIYQVLFFSLLFNIAQATVPEVLMLTSGYQMNPGVNTGLMVLQVLLIMAYVYRYKQQPLPELPELSDSQSSDLRSSTLVSVS